MRKTTLSVSFYGTSEDVLALKAIAAQRGMTFGKFMRSIAESAVGDEIKETKARFFKRDAQSNEHYNSEVSKAS